MSSEQGFVIPEWLVGITLILMPMIVLVASVAPWYQRANMATLIAQEAARTMVLAEDWEARPPRELWRIQVGPGWSSFAVAGRRIFTQEQRGDLEAVVAYDAGSGAELWAHEYESRFFEAMGGAGPRATPTLYEGMLFALGAEGLLHRLEPETGGPPKAIP